MDRSKMLLITAIIVLIVAVLQWTPLRFLPEFAADFAGGAAAGLWIGVLFTWFANRDSSAV
jgi:hypothetical protein